MRHVAGLAGIPYNPHPMLALSLPVNALITAAALGVACAVLSVIVILRSWAFIGEGISHAGFGGVGTAWLLSLAFPVLGAEAPAYLIAVAFCLAVAVGIGSLTRRDRLSGDTAIGIFLVASLAWGFVALSIYQRYGHGAPDWERYLLGNISMVSGRSAAAAVFVSSAMVFALIALRKEILLYSFDPTLAAVSGVRAGFIHYLLMVMLAGVIVIGMGLAGNLLVPAMLILPGAAAMGLSRRLGVVVGLSIGVSVAGAVGGCVISARWRDLPPGATISLVLVVLFVAAMVLSGVRRRLAPAAA
jgi:iron/zinc/copper transport system permease protein